MADITMCSGLLDESECPKKNECFRHMAKANECGQSMFLTPPWSMETVGFSCEYFVDIDDGIYRTSERFEKTGQETK